MNAIVMPDPSFIEAFFSSGHAADAVMAVLVIEGLWLRGRGWSWLRIAGLLGPALFIVLGLRAALVGAAWYWVAVPLTASLPLHLIDLRFRMAKAAD